MKVLVTGGSGFIGSYLVPALMWNGDEVTVLDNFSTGMRPTLGNQPPMFECVEGSILDEELVKKLISKVDKVIHLAAAVGVANIVNSPLLGLRTNVLGSEIVIRNCSKYSKPLLLTSSSEIYGKNDLAALTEDSDRIIGVPQISRWSYSDSKAVEEAFALAYHNEQGLEVKIVRLFNTVGPGQLGDYGMVVPRLMRSAVRNLDIEIYGDGQQTRCFMHVKDAIRGIIKFLETGGVSGQVINLGNPEEISIENLALKIIGRSHSGSKIKFKKHEDIFGVGFEDMLRRVPDISKANQILGWTPSIGIDEIIEDVHRFELLNLDS
jgi:UDP-glucose 4-epimerase